LWLAWTLLDSASRGPDRRPGRLLQENEERALDQLDTTPPAEFPRASRPILKRLASLDKLFIISVLQVFAFYAPFSDVHASHI
jgi:hypothetical protein